MKLAPFIAGRYLIAKKSHNVINIISAISSIGMAIGTAALIIILSVYNGFDSLIRSMMGNVEPDLMITPVEGKAFVPEGEVYDWIYEQESVMNMCCVLQESVFITYEGKHRAANLIVRPPLTVLDTRLMVTTLSFRSKVLGSILFNLLSSLP